MTSKNHNTGDRQNHVDQENTEKETMVYSGPSKSQVKRDCQHLVDVGEEMLKLKADELESLELPAELEAAITTALKIKSRSGLKRQRLYIGKLLRALDNEEIEHKLRKIQHRHDTNTAHFKRLEKWRDSLIEDDKQVLDEIISRFPQIDRQYINQLIRATHKEKEQNKAPTASRKLFKYLRELEDNKDSEKNKKILSTGERK
ncbi:MAG: ribosome biogenesis factor YjgA [Gammaproteobacteria bacterium]|nr:ribosome biogenesis factor YjgA [Gammaproteobacteria bacterium]